MKKKREEGEGEEKDKNKEKKGKDRKSTSSNNNSISNSNNSNRYSEWKCGRCNLILIARNSIKLARLVKVHMEFHSSGE